MQPAISTSNGIVHAGQLVPPQLCCSQAVLVFCACFPQLVALFAQLDPTAHGAPDPLSV
jgi:hypothetical protein